MAKLTPKFKRSFGLWSQRTNYSPIPRDVVRTTGSEWVGKRVPNDRRGTPHRTTVPRGPIVNRRMLLGVGVPHPMLASGIHILLPQVHLHPLRCVKPTFDLLLL